MAEKAKVRSARRAGASPLAREQAVYDANLPRWLPEHEGRHVVIRGDEVAGFYDTRDEALAAGYERFGVVPLLVKPVSPSEPVYHLPNAAL